MSRQERESGIPNDSNPPSPPPPKTNRLFPILFLVLFLLGGAGIAYYYFQAPPLPQRETLSFADRIAEYKKYIDCLDTNLSTQLRTIGDTLSDGAINLRAFLDYKRNTADIFYEAMNSNLSDSTIPNEIEKHKQDLRRVAQKHFVTLPPICGQ